MSTRQHAHLTDRNAAAFHRWGQSYLPELLGIEMLSVEPRRVVGRARVARALLAPTGNLHGGAIVAIADTLCGYGSIASLPEEVGFTTVELKTNFLGTTAEGEFLVGEARPLHLGRTTQVWDATISDEKTGRLLATFRCTQLVLARR
jgi:1,4-dihydroxy-2-naphthoyl-CoA hydrolase